jgi:DNA-binding transcriptional LysR family regulator
MPLDWDKLRMFSRRRGGRIVHPCGEALHMSQSAVSRQVSALEHEVGVQAVQPACARPGSDRTGRDLLYRTANEVLIKLER